MKYQQKGFTLIELMIAMTLGLVLMSAIGKVLIDSKNNFKKQKTLSYLVEDGRYVQEVLAKELRRIGFLKNRKITGNLPADVFTPDVDVLGSGLTLASTEFINAGFNSTGFAGDTYDINHLVVRYQLNDTSELPVIANTSFDASACTRDIHLTAGEDPDSVLEKIVVTLYFYIGFDNTLSTPVLYCLAKRVNLGFPLDVAKNPISAAIPLVSNVERMHILYGVDTSGDTYANQYIRADQMIAALWKDVVSLRIYLILGSEDQHIVSKTPKYLMDGRNYSVNSAVDKRLYKVFLTTVALRNSW